jgi:hypothetical protein
VSSRKLILWLSFGTQIDAGSGLFLEFEMTGHKVGVKVGQHHIGNLHARLFGVLDILIDIPLWIDDNCRFTFGIGDHVGGVG